VERSEGKHKGKEEFLEAVEREERREFKFCGDEEREIL
jgi:hypothetical protein